MKKEAIAIGKPVVAVSKVAAAPLIPAMKKTIAPNKAFVLPVIVGKSVNAVAKLLGKMMPPKMSRQR